jgi:sugar phosphate isomerase/epimerase
VEEKYASFKGFALRYKVKPYTKGPYMIETDRKETFPEGNLAHMDNILAMCRECGAELLLVGAPSPVNDTYERYNALSEYAESRGITYLELNLCTEEIGIDWETDSLDRGDHLNLSGAEKVTEYLGRYLADNYAIADHRNDDAFAEWVGESAEYEKIAAEKLKEIRSKK